MFCWSAASYLSRFDGEHGDVVFGGLVGVEEGEDTVCERQARVAVEIGGAKAGETDVDRFAAALDEAVGVEQQAAAGWELDGIDAIAARNAPAKRRAACADDELAAAVGVKQEGRGMSRADPGKLCLARGPVRIGRESPEAIRTPASAG